MCLKSNERRIVGQPGLIKADESAMPAIASEETDARPRNALGEPVGDFS
jgi:hypothetical protein